MDQRSDIDAHVRRIVGIHFDPTGGAPYWLERAQTLKWDARKEIQGLADLERLGPMDEEALRVRSVLDFVPQSRRGQLAGAIMAETGGATGSPKRTLFTQAEFHQGFVEPFVRVANAVGFPQGGMWLWAGPSGPHIIGRAADACATALGGPQPLTVDFDPRWYRKLPADSVGRTRYLAHVVDQALAVLDREPVDVIFTTPVVLAQLAERMDAAARRRIRGVHYGGMRLAPELLRAAQAEWFPNAVHLAGYGNSLFGVCLEFGGGPDRRLAYHPYGLRHQVRVDADGRVWMSRLDETVLIANLAERDQAAPLPPPNAPTWVGFGAGVADPGPRILAGPAPGMGIY